MDAERSPWAVCSAGLERGSASSGSRRRLDLVTRGGALRFRPAAGPDEEPAGLSDTRSTPRPPTAPRARSPRPATTTPDGCSSKPPGATLTSSTPDPERTTARRRGNGMRGSDARCRGLTRTCSLTTCSSCRRRRVARVFPRTGWNSRVFAMRDRFLDAAHDRCRCGLDRFLTRAGARRSVRQSQRRARAELTTDGATVLACPGGSGWHVVRQNDLRRRDQLQADIAG